MSDRIVWILNPKKSEVNFEEIMNKLSWGQDINLSNFEVGNVVSVVHSFRSEIVDYISDYGLSSLINAEYLTEDVVPKGAPSNQVIPVMHKYLDKIGIDRELIIIDPYFYSRNNDPNAYSGLVNGILSRYLALIDNLIIITLPNRVDAVTKTTVDLGLTNIKATLNIIHKRSEDYHDRIWISNNRSKALITGTSLNGFGNKYTLVDRLNITDVREIISSLTINRLI